MPNGPRYLRDPDWGMAGTFGGTSMDVILGPTAAKSVNYGSKTSAKSIPSLMRPLHARDPDKWVAGHLLNDNLGGDGEWTRNLTPLTKTANRNHATHENRIKNACEYADLFHRTYPGHGYWYGIHYWVDVANISFGNFSPYNKAPSHITINARMVRMDKNTGHMAYIHATDPDYGVMHFTNITALEIHNDDAHL